jgi:hypothetical protein
LNWKEIKNRGQGWYWQNKNKNIIESPTNSTLMISKNPKLAVVMG